MAPQSDRFDYERFADNLAADLERVEEALLYEDDGVDLPAITQSLKEKQTTLQWLEDNTHPSQTREHKDVPATIDQIQAKTGDIETPIKTMLATSIFRNHAEVMAAMNGAAGVGDGTAGGHADGSLNYLQPKKYFGDLREIMGAVVNGCELEIKARKNPDVTVFESQSTSSPSEQLTDIQSEGRLENANRTIGI